MRRTARPPVPIWVGARVVAAAEVAWDGEPAARLEIDLWPYGAVPAGDGPATEALLLGNAALRRRDQGGPQGSSSGSTSGPAAGKGGSGGSPGPNR